MTERDRLIELIKNYPCMSTAEDCFMESIAEDLTDYLLANGVIVPPCKVGDNLYNKYSLIDDNYYWQVARIEIYADESGFIDDSDNWYSFSDIGKTVFLTKAEAEKALKEREQG